jgi:hypothetical protein
MVVGSRIMLWVIIPMMPGLLDTTLCDKVCQWPPPIKLEIEHIIPIMPGLLDTTLCDKVCQWPPPIKLTSTI